MRRLEYSVQTSVGTYRIYKEGEMYDSYRDKTLLDSSSDMRQAQKYLEDDFHLMKWGGP